ncbi:MAG: FlgD immunoglobulin-like domain containing protein [bacterium]
MHVVGTIDRGGRNKTNIDVRYHTNNPNFRSGGGQADEMFVQDIAMSLSFKGNGKPSNRGWTATATMLILDDLGNPVSGATVDGHWSGLTQDIDSGTTGSDGTVSLNSDRINANGIFTFTVNTVTHSILTYNPTLNVITSNSISNLSKSGPAPTESEQIPVKFQLFQNHPNPFNPETSIRFVLQKAGHVAITVYNMRGQLIRQLVSTELAAGEHTVNWNGKDNFGNVVSSGLYFYKMTAGNFSQVKKMSLLQ